jgi:hypothetical protein
MVSYVDNKGITRISRFNDDSIDQVPESPAIQMAKFFNRLNSNIEEMIHNIKKNQINVDIYGNDSGASGIVTLTDQIRTPWLLTDILATWQETILGQSTTAEGTITSPGANATFVTVAAPPAGNYQMYVTLTLAGTVAQGVDNNNIKIVANGATFAILDNSIQATEQTFGPFQITANGANTIVLQTIGAGTAGSIYSGTITITEDLSPTSVTLTIGTRTIIIPPAGGQFQALGMNGMELDNHTLMKLVTSPAAPCSLELMGISDYRKIDRV